MTSVGHFFLFFAYYADFKFDMAPLFVLLKGNQLLTIWVQIHPQSKSWIFGQIKVKLGHL